MKTRNTKRTLLSSALSLVLCVAMLIGTTFAWFTDSASSKNNKIVAGNLDVQLLMHDGADYKDISNTEASIFGGENSVIAQDQNTDTLWEPGKTQVAYLAIRNNGNLDLKYEVALNVKNPADSKDLYKAMQYAIGENKEYTSNKVTAWDAANAKAVSLGIQTVSDTNVALKKGETHYFALSVHMMETAGNEYQGGKIDFDLTVLATQLASEADSFGNQYDANAPKMNTVNGKAYDTPAAALAAAVAGDKVSIFGATDPITIDEEIELTISNTKITAGDGINAITVNANATIIAEDYNSLVGGKGADGIYVAENIALKLTGTGLLSTKGNAGRELDSEYGAKIAGSGIDVNGTIVISNMEELIAEGYGWQAFGIGGHTSSIMIENSSITYAKGGLVATANQDKNYGKNDPEGGAAIGSSQKGALITIQNSTIYEAEGGSKAAGIGALFHVGVSIAIEKSNVTAFGGTYSAAIGGSRVTKYDSAENQAINVDITESTIYAVGGDFAAGIGSGYNTYTSAVFPVITVNIDAKSDIKAQGGLLGAGVGTGHNVVLFKGNIACDTTNIKAGSSEDPDWCCWGYPCSEAEDIGLGVVVLRHFNGVNNTQELANAINGGARVIGLNAGSYTIPTAAQGKELVLIGNKSAVVNCTTYEDCSADGATLDFHGITVQGQTSGDLAGYVRAKANYTNCTFNGKMTLFGTTTFTDCVFNNKKDYAIWTYGAGTAKFTDCTFNSGGKALLVYANMLDNGTTHQTVIVINCIFNDSGELQKAAIETGNDYGRTYELIIKDTVVNGFSVTEKKSDQGGNNLGTNVWGNKNLMTGEVLNVIIDGVEVY